MHMRFTRSVAQTCIYQFLSKELCSGMDGRDQSCPISAMYVLFMIQFLAEPGEFAWCSEIWHPSKVKPSNACNVEYRPNTNAWVSRVQIPQDHSLTNLIFIMDEAIRAYCLPVVVCAGAASIAS